MLSLKAIKVINLPEELCLRGLVFFKCVPTQLLDLLFIVKKNTNFCNLSGRDCVICKCTPF